MIPRQDEVEFDGRWDLKDGKVVSDVASRRIRWLVEHYLVRLGTDPTGWDVLHRDPADGRLWELTYPQSDTHGGGPPRLACLDTGEAVRKYGEVAKR